MDIVDRNDHEPRPEQARPDGESLRPFLRRETDLLDDPQTAAVRLDAEALAGAQPVGGKIVIGGGRLRPTVCDTLQRLLEGGNDLPSRRFAISRQTTASSGVSSTSSRVGFPPFPPPLSGSGNYDGEELVGKPEFTVADAILHLSARRISERELREFEVRKLRGSDFLMGRHAYRLSGDGVSVFPRLADPAEQGSPNLDGERISSGIEALDKMLAEGYWSGASTLIAGPSGCGKTLLGLHFIFGGARDGEPGLIATLQENPSQLERVVKSFDWSLEEDAVEVMYRSPVDIYIDQWFHELLERVERGGVRRVLIDSLDDLGFTTQDEVRFREYMYSLVQRCARNQVSLMMTLEVPDLSRVRISPISTSRTWRTTSSSSSTSGPVHR